MAKAAAAAVPAEFTADEVERWSTVSKTPKGELRHLKPVVQLSETPPYWARPSVPLGRVAVTGVYVLAVEVGDTGPRSM
jgi:hypothetical protein